MMRWCNVKTNEYDQQAKTYPTICTHHKLHNKNENKIPVFPERLLPLDMKKEQLLQDTPPLNTTICFECPWCYCNGCHKNLSALLYINLAMTSKYWCPPSSLCLCDPDFVCCYCSGGENCSEQHKQDLTLFYETFTSAMKTAGEMTFLESVKSNITPVPRWKELLETPHTEARNAYLVWRSTNTPRPGPVHKWIKRIQMDSNMLKKLIKEMKTPFVLMRWLQNLTLEI